MMRKAVVAGVMIATATCGALAEDWRQAAVNLIKSDEDIVLDAMFTQPISFWVAVRDNGSRRDGLAEYFCLSLYEAGMPSGKMVIIKIWDAADMAHDEMTLLGRFNCARN